MAMIAIRAVHVAVFAMFMGMGMGVFEVIIVAVLGIVVAIGAVDMGLLSHGVRSGMKSPGIISPLRASCTVGPNINPVFNSPSSR